MDRAESRPASARIEEAGRGAATFVGVLGDLPRLVLRAERLVESSKSRRSAGFALAPEASRESARPRQGGAGNVALGIGAAALVAIAFRMFH